MGRDPIKGGQRKEEDMKAKEEREQERREGDIRVRLIVNRLIVLSF